MKASSAHWKRGESRRWRESRNQLQENVLLHCVATRLTQAWVHVPLTPQHDGIALQMDVTQLLQPVVSPAPVTHTLWGQVPQYNCAAPPQYVGMRSTQASVQPVVQQAGLAAQIAAVHALQVGESGAPVVHALCAQQVPPPHAKSATTVQAASQVLLQQYDHGDILPNAQTLAAQEQLPAGMAAPV